MLTWNESFNHSYVRIDILVFRTKCFYTWSHINYCYLIQIFKALESFKFLNNRGHACIENTWIRTSCCSNYYANTQDSHYSVNTANSNAFSNLLSNIRTRTPMTSLWSLRGYCTPDQYFDCLGIFSKTTHIGDKLEIFHIGNISGNPLTALEFH